MNQDFPPGFEEETMDLRDEQVISQPLNINKEMEKNSTMLFLYQLVMWGVIFLGTTYLMLAVSLFSANEAYVRYVSALIDNPGSQYLFMAIAVLLAYIPVYFYMKRQNLPLCVQLQKTSASPKIVGIGLILCLAANSVGTLVLIPLESIANGLGYTLIMEMEVGNDVFYYVSSFLYVVIVGPIVEELVYRGGILMGLRRFGDRFAVITSAVIFGLMHGNIPQIIFAILAGLVLGYICVKTNTLRYAILVHILNNFIAIMMSDYLYPNLSEAAVNIIDWTFAIVFLVFGAIVLYRMRNHLKLEKMGEIVVHKPYRRYFTRIPMILVMLLFIIEIVFSVSRL